MRDSERPLTERGRSDAGQVGSELARMNLVPDLVLCSPALRTRQTWDGVAAMLPGPAGEVVYPDALYNGDAKVYLAALSTSKPVQTAMIVGHNPTMEELAALLAVRGTPEALALLERGYPTSGLAVFSFTAELADIGPRSGFLERFLARPE